VAINPKFKIHKSKIKYLGKLRNMDLTQIPDLKK